MSLVGYVTPCNMAKRKKKKVLRCLSPVYSFGLFTALNITLEEAVINNSVARIPLLSYGKKAKTKMENQSDSVTFNKCGVKLLCSSLKQLNSSVDNKELDNVDTKDINNLTDNHEVKIVNNGQKHSPNDEQKTDKPQPEPKLLYNVSKCNFAIELTLDFSKLAELVSFMKLPSPGWQVSIIMNQFLKTACQFSTKDGSKCIIVSQAKPFCNIFMDGVSVILLGCPKTVDSLQDMEILLEIVNRLNFQDCIVDKL